MSTEKEDIIVQPKLSPGEERVEWWRQTLGLFLGPLVFIAIYLLPTPSLSDKAHVLASILGLVVIYWISEAIPIPVTALLGAGLCVIFRVASAKKVLAPFADPIVFLFIGSFIIARAMSLHGLDRRFAMKVFSLRWIGGSPLRLLVACGGISALLSMWISNTASTAIMLPIGIGIIKAIERSLEGEQEGGVWKGVRYRAGFMLMIAYGASVGGIATPVGSPPNLIAIGMIDSLVDYRITFFQWMAIGIPLLSIMFLVLFLILWFLFPPPTPPKKSFEKGGWIGNKEREMWTRGEIFTLVSFFLAVILWIFPGLVAIVSGSGSETYKFIKSILNEGVVAILAAFILFLLPINRRKGTFAINWDQAVRIDWGTILLFGGGLTLGRLMFETGLAEAIGTNLITIGGVTGVWSITAFSIIIGIIVSETTSNTASASMVVPVMIAIAKAAGVSPIPPALGAAFGASFGFMLPVSTPPNAIVYGSGMVPILSMMRAGILFDILGFIMIWVGLRILCPILGFI